MPRKEIPDSAIEAVAQQINARSTKNHGINVVGNAANIETPQIFEILPFAEIDKTEKRFYAIDGSYNSEEFYNGLAIAMYTAGYVCFHHGKQLRMNGLDDPVVLGQAYSPENILVTNQEQLEAIYDEMLTLKPIERLLEFWGGKTEDVFPYDKRAICTNLSTLLSFCQNILEIALILEIAELPETKPGDFVLRDGTLRSLHVKQRALVSLGKYIHEKGVHVIAITKQSPVKMELSYTFKQIDNYLQDDLKKKYPFVETDPKRKKLCCWFEVPDSVLQAAYQGGMFAKKDITGGRGFGLFFAARLDYVEKLQNYDWVIVDVNIFDAIPGIESNVIARNTKALDMIFKELTRLTQEHYILGYPYPLAEAHSFISLKRDFKQEIVNRLKYSLYKDQRMDHVDIENLFLDTHERF
jgi:NurA domain-containing protein